MLNMVGEDEFTDAIGAWGTGHGWTRFLGPSAAGPQISVVDGCGMAHLFPAVVQPYDTNGRRLIDQSSHAVANCSSLYEEQRGGR